VPSVCPYCAVGCGQIVSVRDGQIVNIEGNPDSPINRGTLCPKGSATYQLAVNPNRLTSVKYRAPYATDWEEKPLDWAMDRIAALMKETRDETFTETWEGRTRRAIRSRSASTTAPRSPRSAARRWTTSGTTST
jgi:formate dehydrogenase major subunit